MIACDGCDEWFHPECLGTTYLDLVQIDTYFCVECRRVSRAGLCPHSVNCACARAFAPDVHLRMLCVCEVPNCVCPSALQATYKMPGSC